MGYTIDPNYEPKGVPLDEAIRQIVREELAAHEERLRGEPVVIALSDEKKIALSKIGRQPLPI